MYEAWERDGKALVVPGAALLWGQAPSKSLRGGRKPLLEAGFGRVEEARSTLAGAEGTRFGEARRGIDSANLYI